MKRMARAARPLRSPVNCGANRRFSSSATRARRFPCLACFSLSGSKTAASRRLVAQLAKCSLTVLRISRFTRSISRMPSSNIAHGKTVRRRQYILPALTFKLMSAGSRQTCKRNNSATHLTQPLRNKHPPPPLRAYPSSKNAGGTNINS